MARAVDPPFHRLAIGHLGGKGAGLRPPWDSHIHMRQLRRPVSQLLNAERHATLGFSLLVPNQRIFLEL